MKKAMKLGMDIILLEVIPYVYVFKYLPSIILKQRPRYFARYERTSA